MIPIRVKMSGFLSYKDEQEIPFSGSHLWMLAGVNGSGKSSVFDAVTYALFGHHRGGSQNAAELINKESNALAVEFDFSLDGRLYRIKRTLKRGSRGNATGTQQLFGRAGVDSQWEAVPDTNKKVDFDAWVDDHVGLSYETFTSSVLLLQGKAEKLLDSKPSGRAEVLAGIVDLARYQRMYEKANAKRLAFKGQLEALTHQQQAVPEIGDLEYAAAAEAIELAEEARTEAQSKVDSLLKLAEEARRWTDAQARLAAAGEKLRQAEHLLGEAVKIEKAFARLGELKAVLPAVSTVVTVRARLHESEHKTSRLLKDREATTVHRDQVQHNLETAKKKKANLQKTLAADEEKLAKGSARLRELASVLQGVKLAEDQQAELRRLEDELKRLPPEPESIVRAAQDAHDRLVELGRVVPILDRLHAERAELMQALPREDAAQRKADEVQEAGRKLRGDYDKLLAEVEPAKRVKAKADEAAAGTAVLARQARELADDFANLAGQKTCRACGQPLTPGHFEMEKKRREADRKAAEKKHAEAVAAQREAGDRESELRFAETAAKERLDRLRDEYKELFAEIKRVGADADRHVRFLKIAYAELPEPYQSRVAPAQPEDWASVSYPSRDELSRLRQEAAGIDAAKRQLRESADTLDRWKRLTAKAEAARQTLSRLREGLPAGDPAAVREEHRTLQAAEAALVNDIKGTKAGIRSAEDEIDRFGRDAHTAMTMLTEIAGRVHTEEVNRANCRERIDGAMRGLPTDWQFRVEKAGLADYTGWKDESEELLAADTEARYKQLEQARGGLESLRADLATLVREAEAFPAEARRSPDEVAALVADARKQHEAADKLLTDARRRKAVLDGHRERRAELGELFKQTDAEHNRYKLLAELLGRDRLQRHLVRQAERQIVDYANGMLDRLSGGQLFLKLVGTDDGAADKALDLECYNRVTGGSPINVAFLSGSQKFRVAVSLALGIGQYASKQHRPIESVIIDEGFGCLDRNGRQVMIQELQNLRGHLQCILLVSHQEEFADAFPDGYRFELQDGATRVSRFQR
jgi:DNA repair exonuclease SbcCD ATPase subunit